jgi:hypothetical protein
LERYSIFLKSLSVSPFCAGGMLLMISSCPGLGEDVRVLLQEDGGPHGDVAGGLVAGT